MHIYRVLIRARVAIKVSQARHTSVQGQAPLDNEQANFLFGVYNAQVGDTQAITTIPAQIVTDKVISDSILVNLIILI